MWQVVSAIALLQSAGDFATGSQEVSSLNQIELVAAHRRPEHVV
jgi:hypothetical protein